MLCLQETQKEHLEHLLGRQYGFLHGRARRNTDYLIENLEDREDIIELLESGHGGELVERVLKMVEHTYRPRTGYTEEPENAEELSPRQLVRAYLLLEALGKGEFLGEIGNIVKGDLKDPHAEHGGLIRFRNGRLAFVPVESALREDNNEAYLLPEKARDVPNAGYFHLHATTEDDSEYAGPSGGKSFVRGGDIAVAQTEAFYHGESHNAVITKLTGKEFNMDYYSTETGNDIHVLDLGNYPTKAC